MPQPESNTPTTLLRECKRLFLTKVENQSDDSDPIERQIDQVNKKTILWAFVMTVLVDIFAIPVCPMLSRFSWLSLDILFLMGWACIVSTFAFLMTGSLLFHVLGRGLVDEAKKRGKYLFKIRSEKIDVLSSPLSADIRDNACASHNNVITDPSYSHHPLNIHYTDRN